MLHEVKSGRGVMNQSDDKSLVLVFIFFPSWFLRAVAAMLLDVSRSDRRPNQRFSS